jgi:hypothetical protein
MRSKVPAPYLPVFQCSKHEVREVTVKFDVENQTFEPRHKPSNRSRMKNIIALVLLLITLGAHAADVPPASEEVRAQRIKEYTAVCVKGIEDVPELRTVYSGKTVHVYCTCRQRFHADVLANAQKEGRRGKAVSEEAYDYADKKCGHILLKNLESE